LYKVISIEDYFRVDLDYYYKEFINVSSNEFDANFINEHLVVYIGDNHVNSFEKLPSFELGWDTFHNIRIRKESAETKLPPPYNSCQDSSYGKPYHRLTALKVVLPC